MRIIDYFITGLKLIGLGIVAFIIHFIITMLLGGISVFSGTSSVLLFLISIPLIIIIDGWLAYKMWKWK